MNDTSAGNKLPAAIHAGRVAIVTGAARGIGQAVALLLAERGAKLVLVDRTNCDETAAAIGGDVVSFVGDVTSRQTWVDLAVEAESKFGGADIVVNNAGIYPFNHIDDLNEDTWRRVMAINLDAHYHSAKVFAPLMKRAGWGRFITISSNAIGVTAPGVSLYVASKMGAIGFVRGLANDLGNDGITVNAILPAFTETPGVRDMPPEVREGVVQMQAIKRLAQPRDIAGPVSFLASEDASFITGQAIPVDGGMYKVS